MGEVKQGSRGCQAWLGGREYRARLQVPVWDLARMQDGVGWDGLECGRMGQAEMI